MWAQKHSSTAWIVGIYRPERLISEHLRDLTKQFRLCIFSAAWRCRQVGKDTHTHTHLHTWKHPFSSIVLHAIVLSAFRSTSVIHQRGALTFRLLSVRRPLPHSTDELVVHSRLQNGSRSIQKECITVEWMISKETRSGQWEVRTKALSNENTSRSQIETSNILSAAVSVLQLYLNLSSDTEMTGREKDREASTFSLPSSSFVNKILLT